MTDRQYLMDKDKFLSAVFEAAMDGIFIIDLQGRYIEVNPAGCDMFGYAKEEFLASDVSLLLFPEDVERSFYIGRKDWRAGAFVPEYRMRRKDGSEIWVEMTVKPINIGGVDYAIGIKRDVTARRRMLSALLDEKERAEKYFDVAGVMLIVLDREQRVVKINRKGLELLGRPEREVVGRDWFDGFVPDAHRERLKRHFRSLLSKEFPNLGYYENPVMTKDGAEKMLAWNNTVLTDEKGRPFATLSSGEDITARKAAEQELLKARASLEERVRERTAELQKANYALEAEMLGRRRIEEEVKRNAELLQSFIDNSAAVIFLKDADGRYLLVNRLYETLFNKGREDVVGKTDYDFFPMEQADVFRTNDREVLRAGKPLHVEEAVLHPDGTVHTYISVKFPIPSMPGAVCGIATDITERKRVEEELKRHTGLLSDAQRIARLGSWDWDIANNALEWSDEIYRIFGLEPREFGATYEAFLNSVHPDDREAVKGAVNDALYAKKPYSIDHRVVLPDGAVRVVHEQADVYSGPDGKPVRMTGTVQDITERKMMEDEILKAQKLESIGTLAGGLAHDFNNLLLGIVGNISLVKALIDPKEKAYALLSDVENSAQRIKTLARTMLTFSKGGAPLREPVNICNLVKDVSSMVLKGSDIRAEYSFPTDLPNVEIDEGQIGQVINNVVLNARHAMHDAGALKVEAEAKAVVADDALPLKPGDYVIISIKDTGDGMDKEVLSRMFDPFFTTKAKASGLGLAVSYSIIKKHAGFIRAESRPGKGSTVRIYLPAPAKKGPEGAVADNGIVRGSGRVLVMDDEELVRDVSEEMLNVLGYEAEFARDGHEAVALYKKALDSGSPFDAVILDLTVPGGMGGRETIKRLLEIDPKVRAIVSSGYSKDAVMSDYKRHGFSGVIAKPYRVSEFSRVVKDVITSGK